MRFNSQWNEVPISRINFHVPKAVQAIEVQLYSGFLTLYHAGPITGKKSIVLPG